MKTVKILFKHTGENDGTPKQPHAEWLGQVDLNEFVVVCVSFDNDMLTTTAKWEVREVNLPEWLPVAEWLNDYVSWGYMWGRGVSPELPEQWQRKLLALPGSIQFAAAELLRVKKFRSEFRASLRAQLESWLNDKSDYVQPFSRKQFGAVFNTYAAMKLKQIEHNLYRSKACYYGAAA